MEKFIVIFLVILVIGFIVYKAIKMARNPPIKKEKGTSGGKSTEQPPKKYY